MADLPTTPSCLDAIIVGGEWGGWWRSWSARLQKGRRGKKKKREAARNIFAMVGEACGTPWANQRPRKGDNSVGACGPSVICNGADATGYDT